MYFYQRVDQFNYESIVDYLVSRARKNGIEPDVTHDIMILWDDAERNHDAQSSLSIFGKLYISQQLLDLV